MEEENKIEIDFSLNLQGLKVDKNPKTFHLSIAVKLSQNKALSQSSVVQKEILEGINTQEIVGSGIYRYKPESIHFTVLHFEGFSSSIEPLSGFQQKRNFFINKIKSIFASFDKKEVADKKIRFSYIYTEDTESLAIQAFPSKELLKFFKTMKDAFEEEPDLKPVKIKNHSFNCSKRFATNIVRFFREVSKDEYDQLADNIKSFNDRCAKKGEEGQFNLELKKLTFVISDNWMNESEEQASIELK